ncbi:MAG: hypothetical protein WAT66_00185 [Actinomycetota bacterium]
MRPRPNYRRRRTITLFALLVIVVIVVALLSRSGTEKESPTPTLAFTTKVAAVNQGKAADAGEQEAQGQAIEKMFNDYYQEAFVDPEKWGDGRFEDLKALFAEDAQASFTKDIQSLTIGQGRIDFKRVEPSASDLVITIYYDAKSQPTFAVAAATFNARGTLKKTGPAVTIKQKATFYLQKSGDKWVITAYDADQSQNTPTPSPSPSAS